MSIFDQIAAKGVVPVIALDDAHHALPLADALAEGRLNMLKSIAGPCLRIGIGFNPT